MKRLLAAVFLLGLALPARAVPDFTTKETGITLIGTTFSSAVFVSMTGAYADAGGGVRGFYLRGSSWTAGSFAISSAVYSARSTDGLAWVDEGGVRVSSDTTPLVDVAISSITGATVLPLTGGGYRMLYSIIGTTGTYAIYTATSADGLSWTNEYSSPTILAANAGKSWLTSPTAVKLNNGNWRLYFIQNSIAGNQPANHQIVSALSTNEGSTFGAAAAVVSPANEVAALKRTDGRVRLVYTSPNVNTSTSTQMLSALSSTVLGSAFSVEAGVRLSTTAGTGSMFQPSVFRSTDSFRWRVYYTWIPFAPPSQSTGDVNTAVTDNPDLQSVAPATVMQSNPAVQFSLKGEVFDTAAVTTFLKMAGQANIVGAGIVRTDDQNITVTYNTQNQSLGFWDAVVTNGNGLTSTVTGAVFIDFQGGTVNLTDNLFRPLLGTTMKIKITIFTPGQVSVRLYTLNGELVNNLFSGYMPAGTNNLTWDAKTGHGATVASGVYLLKVTGPKLDTINKVVVIK